MVFVIEVVTLGWQCQARAGQTILEAVRAADMSGGMLTAPCGGNGVCGKCRVKVIEGELSSPTETEKRLLSGQELAAGFRLACQAQVTGPVRLELAPSSAVLDQQPRDQSSLDEGLGLNIVPEPAVRRLVVDVKATTIDYPQSLWDQVRNAVAERAELADLAVDLDLMRRKPALATDASLTVSLRGREVGNAYLTGQAPLPVGLAVDLGTTKIAGYLVDLETGATLTGKDMMNPQTAYGADVVSRLVHALQGEDSYRQIRGAVVEGLNRLAGALAEEAGIEREHIEEAVVAGNTAMHHLLLGLPAAQLARSPYVPAASLPVEVKARELGLNLAPGAFVYLTPPIAGYVGGDHVTMILASGIDESTVPTLGIDIGTNTEIVLAYKGAMTCCSCASGPAFEGAHIKHGMRAVAGAIYEVRLSAGGLDVEYETVGGKAALGLCGSGVLDLVSELRRTGVMKSTGNLDRQHSRVRLSEQGVPEFLVAAESDGGNGREVVFTQKDISEIQLAKAAIAAGTQVLMAHAGLQVGDLEQVVVAGAFGTGMRIESAVSIGMLPNVSREKFRQVGNAAGAGARWTLASLSARRRAEKIAREVGYVELTASPAFSRAFMRQVRFPDDVAAFVHTGNGHTGNGDTRSEA